MANILRPSFALLVALLVGLIPVTAPAQGGGGVPRADKRADFAPLQGRWVRSDAPYVIHVTGVDAAGKLAATYSNPNLLPFWSAQATRENGVLKAFLELRVAGYNGSTYTLTYDPQRDVLTGVYFQANSRQSYDVQFVRSR